MLVWLFDSNAPHQALIDHAKNGVGHEKLQPPPPVAEEDLTDADDLADVEGLTDVEGDTSVAQMNAGATEGVQLTPRQLACSSHKPGFCTDQDAWVSSTFGENMGIFTCADLVETVPDWCHRTEPDFAALGVRARCPRACVVTGCNDC